MNRNLRRKRRCSESFETDDSSHNEKKFKNEMENDVSDNREELQNDCSSPSIRSSIPEGSSSRLSPSISIGHDASSECGCDSCELGSEPLRPLVRSQNTSEADPDLLARESELDESRDVDLIYSPTSNNGYSSCDDGYAVKRITGSELVSSPVAESIEDSDFEEEEFDEHKNSSENDENDQSAGKAVCFMGQLTPDSSVRKFKFHEPECSTWTSFRKMSTGSELYALESACPVPQLPWARREEFWEVMCRKDELSLKTRDPELFNFQQHLRPRMRVILLDWISEVAELFKLHRETYYLTVDYIDRYLSCVENIPKSQLQLIGITCLALASKMEEIYPPKIHQFADVTDGACTEQEIFAMEVAILKHLNWLLSPITVNNWLEMMLQFIYQKLENKNKNMLTPHFSSTLFKRLCQLLDLVTLDITSLRFSYGVLVAAAIYILVDPHLAISTSGLRKEILEPCVQWMSVYWNVLRDTYTPEMQDVNDLLTDKSEIYFGDQHPELQTHSISMNLYDIAQEKFELLAAQKDLKLESGQILTPPSSSSKSTTAVTEGDSF